jgi:site-specific recombinase XerD
LVNDERHPWTMAVETWATTLRMASLSPSTVDGYTKHIGWLAGDLSLLVTDPWELAPEQLTQWLDDQNWSGATRARVLVSVRSFYTWGVLAGLCRRSPMTGVAVAPPRIRGPQRLVLPSAWVEPLATFQTWLRAGARTETTIDRRREHVSRFAQSHAFPWDVTPADLARWLSRADWSPAYKRSVRSSLRSFYGWAHRFGHLPINPSRDLDPVRQRRQLPRPAPDDAVQIALGAADGRTTLLLQLAIYAGLRCHEIAGLHTRDVGEESLHVVGKAGHERMVPLHPDLAHALQVELRRRRDGIDLGTGWGKHIPTPDGWLFPSDVFEQHLTARWVGRLMARVLPPGWTAHTLRHRFATQAYRAGRDLRAVQELLGHSKPETTARYAAVPEGALTTAVLGVGLIS